MYSVRPRHPLSYPELSSGSSTSSRSLRQSQTPRSVHDARRQVSVSPSQGDAESVHAELCDDASSVYSRSQGSPDEVSSRHQSRSDAGSQADSGRRSRSDQRSWGPTNSVSRSRGRRATTASHTVSWATNAQRPRHKPQPAPRRPSPHPSQARRSWRRVLDKARRGVRIVRRMPRRLAAKVKSACLGSDSDSVYTVADIARDHSDADCPLTFPAPSLVGFRYEAFVALQGPDLGRCGALDFSRRRIGFWSGRHALSAENVLRLDSAAPVQSDHDYTFGKLNAWLDGLPIPSNYLKERLGSLRGRTIQQSTFSYIWPEPKPLAGGIHRGAVNRGLSNPYRPRYSSERFIPEGQYRVFR